MPRHDEEGHGKLRTAFLKNRSDSAGQPRPDLETCGDFSNQRWVFHRRRVDGDLVGASVEYSRGIGKLADSSADRKRNKQTACRAGDDIEHGVAPIAGSRDIEQNDLVRAIARMGGGTFRRIPGVAQVHELYAFYDAAVVHIETGDDALGQHLSPS